MTEFFTKEISIYINGKEHNLVVSGEVEVSPLEIEYGWNHVPYELGGGIEITRLDEVYLIHYGSSKTESEIPSDAFNIEKHTKLNGEVEFWWERHRLIELSDNLNGEIVARLEELYINRCF